MKDVPYESFSDNSTDKRIKESSLKHCGGHPVLAVCLEKADGRTRKNHNLKFRHIGYNVDPYGQSFFPKCISAWNGLTQEIAEANTLDLFKSKLAH